MICARLLAFCLTVSVMAAVALVPVDFAGAKPIPGTQDLDPGQMGRVDGVGIASRDINSMADIAIRDLLTRADIVGRPRAPPCRGR